MTGSEAKTVKPPRKPAARAGGPTASGARKLVKAAQLVGEITGAADNFPSVSRRRGGGPLVLGKGPAKPARP
jgi:hypothetical protein